MRILKRSIVVFGTACFSKIAAVCRTKLPLLGYTPDSSSGDIVLDAGSSNVSVTFVGAEVEQTHHRRAQAVEQSWSHRRYEYNHCAYVDTRPNPHQVQVRDDN